jgi:acetyl esterase/lipase
MKALSHMFLPALTPAAGYPIQFRQAILALQHVLKSGISPADIVISGDSAGGTLVMEVISQCLHPNSSIPSMPIPSVPFAGILAISPWVVFESNVPSFVNDGGDNLSNRLLRYFAELLLQNSVLTDTKGVPEEYWREPLRAPPDWWRGSEKVTKHIMFIYGEREALRDDIVSFVEKVREGVSGTEMDIASVQDPIGVHIAPVIDALMDRAPGETTKIMANWVHDRIAT